MSENVPSTSQVLLDFLKILAVPLAAVGGYLGSWFQNRKKLRPELAILDANARKTRAEAKKIDGEALDQAWERIDELAAVNFQLRKDCLELQKKVDLADLRDNFNAEQRKRMKALLDIHSIKYSEFDEPKPNK